MPNEPDNGMPARPACDRANEVSPGDGVHLADFHVNANRGKVRLYDLQQVQSAGTGLPHSQY